MDFEQPILRAWPDDRAHVHTLRHDAIRQQTGNGLHDRRAANAQLGGQAR